MTTGGQRPSYSNWGDTDSTGSPHENVFVLPGGEGDAQNCIAEYAQDGTYFHGTSFSAAFATGLIGCVIGDQLVRGVAIDHDTTLSHLRSKSDAGVGTVGENGNGLMKLSLVP